MFEDSPIAVVVASRITSFYCNEERKMKNVVMLFWSDGSVTWQPE